VLVSTFGGGSGVMCTDQCEREGLQVPLLREATQSELKPLVTPLSSVANPIDLTPGMMTVAKHRANVPAALARMADADETDAWLFLAAGFDRLAPELVDMFDAVRRRASKPILLTWQAMPEGTAALLASRGIFVFPEHARAARALRHLVRHADARRSRIRQIKERAPFAWDVAPGTRIVAEDGVAAIFERAGLPAARGRNARSAGEAARTAEDVGFPVAMKALSPAITHRAAAGLVALDVASPDAASAIERRFHARAAQMGVTLDGIWVQHMFEGQRELLVTAFRDREFGVIVGCGVGGGATELVDDVVFARAPIDADGAHDLIALMRTLQRSPQWLTARQHALAARFVAAFSTVAASAPWKRFTLEVNPLKLGDDAAAAVDGLLIIEED
jgi:acetate---CoA ligase (ADP-forming)